MPAKPTSKLLAPRQSLRGRVERPLVFQMSVYAFDREDIAVQLRRAAKDIQNGTTLSWESGTGVFAWKIIKRKSKKGGQRELPKV